MGQFLIPTKALLMAAVRTGFPRAVVNFTGFTHLSETFTLVNNHTLYVTFASAPVPEPDEWTMMLLGFPLLLRVTKRKNPARRTG
jgi:hypothetical protein